MMSLLYNVLVMQIALPGFVIASIRVCYYSNWSQYRPGLGKFFPSDIPPKLCTHLIYSFAKVNSRYELDTYEWNDEQLYKTFNNLKQSNPNLKTLLATGGWNAGSTIYSQMVNNVTLRRKFAKQSIEFVRQHDFDGFDLDWEYPALRGGVPSDKPNFIELIKDLKAEIALDAARNPGKPILLLTAAVAAGQSNIDVAYDIPAMGEHLDFINLMSYDLHGAWENFTGHNSPLYSRSGESGGQEKLNIDWAARYWVTKGYPKKKLIIGLATYGRHFQLMSTGNSGFGALVRGAGTAGPMTRESGFLAYYEVCNMLAAGAKRKWNNEHMVPYLVSGDQWVGYDDEESFAIKLDYIKREEYGGAMVWNIDLDDFNQQCSLSSRRYPLMSLMAEVLGGNITVTTNKPVTGSTSGTTETQTDATSGVTTDINQGFTCTGKSDGFYRDPADCSKYYQCWSGNQYHSSCPSGLMWNQDKKYCDYPGSVNCRIATTTTTSKPETTSETTTEHTTTESTTSSTSTTSTTERITSTTERKTTTTSTTEEATTSQTDRPTEGPSEYCVGRGNGLHKNPEDCGSFYSCWEGTTTLYQCAQGTLYNAEAKICDWEQNVDCGDEEDTTEFCSDKADGLYTYPDNCSKYYNCGSGITYVLSCNPGTYWQPSARNCDWIANVDCGDRPVPPAARNLGNVCATRMTDIFPDTSNCHNFIRCVNGHPHFYSCGNYLKFNPASNACDWPDNVHCFNPVRRSHRK